MKIQLAHVAARDGGGVSVKVRLSDGEHREVRRFALTDADWRRIAQSIEESIGASIAESMVASIAEPVGESMTASVDAGENARQAPMPPSPDRTAFATDSTSSHDCTNETVLSPLHDCTHETALPQSHDRAPVPSFGRQIPTSLRPAPAKGASEDAFSSLAGCLLTPEQFDELECAGEFCAALNKGAELLSYGANSRRALELKLRRYGYDGELCSRVGEELCRRGLIREASDASSIVRVCLRSGYGKNRIIAKLRQKGYGDEAVREALDGVDESVYTENCAALIKKKFGYIPSDADGRRKMAASLARYGYSFSQIKAAMLAVKDDE